MEKNFDTLKPFPDDPEEAARLGLVNIQGNEEFDYLAGPDEVGKVAIRGKNRLHVWADANLRLKPLIWHLGRALYPGDMLYRGEAEVEVRQVYYSVGMPWVKGTDDGDYKLEYLSWEPPKRITLELNTAQARTLQTILSLVGGNSSTTLRKYADEVAAKLEGVSPYPMGDCDDKVERQYIDNGVGGPGRIYFTEKTLDLVQAGEDR